MARRAATKADMVLAAVILSAAVASLIFLDFAVFAGTPNEASVEVDGKIISRYRLSEIGERRIVDINTEFGFNRLEIDGTGVAIKDADCPDKLDVRQGRISRANQCLICLPNRLIVRLEGNNVNINRVDGVAY